MADFRFHCVVPQCTKSYVYKHKLREHVKKCHEGVPRPQKWHEWARKLGVDIASTSESEVREMWRKDYLIQWRRDNLNAKRELADERAENARLRAENARLVVENTLLKQQQQGSAHGNSHCDAWEMWFGEVLQSGKNGDAGPLMTTDQIDKARRMLHRNQHQPCSESCQGDDLNHNTPAVGLLIDEKYEFSEGAS